MFRKSLPMALVLFAAPTPAIAEDLTFGSRVQTPAATGTSFDTRLTQTTWKSPRTALIVCDVWDYHHCLNAVRRLEEFAPRMNDLVKLARGKGVAVIHAPSDCMAAKA